jgi:hypothetical protein
MLHENEFEEVIKDGRTVAVRDLTTGRTWPMVAGGEGDDDQAGDDSNKDEDGNVGKLKDEGAARAAAADDGKDDDAGDDDVQAAADSGAKIPTKRFNKVIGQRDEARRALAAKDAEIAAERVKLARYERYEAEIAKEEKDRIDAENAKKGIPSVEEQNARWDRLLDQRYGPGAAQDFEAQRETRQMELSRLTREAHTHLKTLLTEHGMPGVAADKEAFTLWDRQVGAALRSTPERVAKFKDPLTTTEAIDEAFDEVKRFIADPAVAASSAGRIKALARRRAAAPSSSGGNTAPEVNVAPLKPPKEMTDPRQRASWWERHIERQSREMDANDADNQ